MATSGHSEPGTDGEPITLSTGHSVRLPVDLEATMVGATFAAPRDAVADLLPTGLRPIRATARGAAAVTLLSVEYHAVGVPDMDPHDEFAVILLAHHDDPAGVPYVSPILEATNGYVWYMPATTEPSRAFGDEVWGFPKVVGDVDHTDRGDVRETTVTVDGERFVTFAVDRPPAVSTDDEGLSYTIRDDRLHRVQSDIDAAIGAWPFSSGVSVSFGKHPKADPLRSLDFGGRALARVSLDGTVSFRRAIPV